MTMMREYRLESDGLLAPRMRAAVTMVPRHVPDETSGIPGFPETRKEIPLWIETDFQLKFIDVDPECLPHFVVHQCFLGADPQWNVNERGVAAAILAQHPDFPFKKCPKGLSISLVIENTSQQPRSFRAKLVGVDIIGRGR